MKRMIHILLMMGLVATAAEMAIPMPVDGLSPAVRAADEHDDVLKAIKRGELMSYAKIKRIAEARLHGVVVGQQLRRTNRGWQYYLRIRKKDGKVIVAIMDARTGEVVGTR